MCLVAGVHFCLLYNIFIFQFTKLHLLCLWCSCAKIKCSFLNHVLFENGICRDLKEVFLFKYKLLKSLWEFHFLGLDFNLEIQDFACRLTNTSFPHRKCTLNSFVNSNCVSFCFIIYFFHYRTDNDPTYEKTPKENPRVKI